jgi:D-aspartate ligase
MADWKNVKRRIGNSFTASPSAGSQSAPSHAVVVAGLGFGANAARRLVSLGYDVWGLTHDVSEPGWHVRGMRRLRSPDPVTDFDEWLRFMCTLGGSLKGMPSLLPMGDIYVLACDRGADELHKHFALLGFGTGLRTSLTSKRSTFELADKHDFPRPAWTYVASHAHLAEFARDRSAPILIKPDLPFQWRSGPAAAVVGRRKVIAGSAKYVLQEYDRLAAYTPGVVAQEVIPGPDDHLIYWCGLLGPDGRVGGRLVGRKIRVSPVHFGSATFVKLIDDRKVEDLCERFLKDIGYQGLCGIELKEDTRDGIAKLIEVNPRYSLWDDIGVPVRAQLGYQTVPMRPRRFDQKWIDIGRDVAVMSQYRREGIATWRDWLRDLTPPIRVNDRPLADDPLFALRLLWHRARKASKVYSRVARGRRSQAP